MHNCGPSFLLKGMLDCAWSRADIVCDEDGSYARVEAVLSFVCSYGA